METLELDEWRIEYDREATVAAHDRTSPTGPETCGCDPCRNWAATRQQLLVPEFRQMLLRLGIPFDREVEVYHNARLPNGLHSYGLWYHFVGRVVYGAVEGSPSIVFGGMTVFFHSKPALMAEGFSKSPVAELEVAAEVPWLSELPEPV